MVSRLPVRSRAGVRRGAGRRSVDSLLAERHRRAIAQRRRGRSDAPMPDLDQRQRRPRKAFACPPTDEHRDQNDDDDQPDCGGRQEYDCSVFLHPGSEIGECFRPDYCTERSGRDMRFVTELENIRHGPLEDAMLETRLRQNPRQMLGAGLLYLRPSGRG